MPLPVGYKRINADGSRNIYCYICGNFISTTSAMTSINTAMCVICQADEDGIDLTPEQVRELRSARMAGSVVSQAIAFPERPKDPMEEFSPDLEDYKMSSVGYRIKALVTKVIRAGAKVILDTIPESKVVAKAKKRRRIFEQDIDPD
jgi:hypothetical protein